MAHVKFLSRVVALFLFSLSPLSLADELTEAQALERGLANIHGVIEARRSEAKGQAANAGRWENPELEFSQEQRDLTAGSSEERFIWLRQPLDLLGKKSLQRKAAELQAEASNKRIDIFKREAASQIRESFYQSLALEESLQVLRRLKNRLQELTLAVRQRVDAGDASRYDLMRLEREAALIESELLTQTAQANAAQEQLFAIVGGGIQALQGEILPPPFDIASTEALVANHPLPQALKKESESAAISERAAQRERWPELSVGIGYSELEEPGVSLDGSAYSFSLKLPLFDRGQGEQQIAASRARQRRSEYHLAIAELTAELRATIQTLDAQRNAALLLQASGDFATAGFSTIAEHAYDAGEISVMELIDAHRTELNARQTFLEHALAARRTYIQLQAMRDLP